MQRNFYQGLKREEIKKMEKELQGKIKQFKKNQRYICLKKTNRFLVFSFII